MKEMIANYQFTTQNPSEFIFEVSEHYANIHYFKDASPTDVLKNAKEKMMTIDNVSFYLNRSNDKDGNNYLMDTFKWVCTDDVELMTNWFRMLVELGADPMLKNKKGETAVSIAFDRMNRYDSYTKDEVNSLLFG